MDINPKLVDIARSAGFKAQCCNFLDNKLNSDEYDVVHCAHVIEHFKYPEVVNVIDELVRVTKIGGFLVIRTPLMWKNFYNDIDHVRPYPPGAIIRYFISEKQQKKSNNSVETYCIWYRTSAKEIEQIDKTNMVYCITPLRSLLNKIINSINCVYTKLWNRYRWPSSKPTGYVMILKKLS